MVSGFPQGEATGLFLGEEFHHNRIAVVCSQISGVSPEVDHRWNVPRLERTVIELAAAGRLDVTSLVSHTFPAAEVAQAFALLAESPEHGAGRPRLHRGWAAMMRLACQERLLPGDTVVERWDNARRAGYDGIELHGPPGFALRERLPELRRAAAEGVVFSSVCVAMRHFIGDFDAERRPTPWPTSACSCR